jgi:hypothetical protein
MQPWADEPRFHLWSKAGIMAVKADEFYTWALDPEDGFDGVIDIPLPTPAGALLAVAKLGRWGPHTDTMNPLLIVTVVTGRLVLIAAIAPETQIPEIADCAARAVCVNEAAGRDPSASLEELKPLIAACPTRGPTPGVTQTSGDGWGPFSGAPFEAWRICERQGLPTEPYFGQLKRGAEEISGRLARAR